MRNSRFYLNILLVVMLGTNSIGLLHAQKTFTKVLGRPEKFTPPVDMIGEAEIQAYYTQPSPYSRKDPWLVFSDRANNQTYQEPTPTARKQTILDYKEALYVVNEKDGWVEIVSGTTDELKLIRTQKYKGWIRKDKLLLWQECVIDQRTRIHKKALLLNKATDIPELIAQGDKNIVNVFNDPYDKTPILHANIYRYFFVFKRENNRLLLAQEYRLSPSNVEIRLLGWVSSARIVEWNTRVCLEPNFDENAFSERKLNPDKYKLVAYGNAGSAVRQLKSGIISSNDEIWSNDPAFADPVYLAKSNPRRFIGNIIRFPLLPRSTNQDPNVYSSGLIGDIYVSIEGSDKPVILDEKAYLATKEAGKTEQQRKSKINVMYVVEGSTAMAPYKEQLKNLFANVKANMPGFENISVGMTVYRDVAERKEQRDIEILPATVNESDFIEFVDGLEFASIQDEDELSNMRDGIMQGILRGGLGKDASNFIVILGYQPDFSANKTRKEGAIASHDPAYHTREEVVEALTKINGNVFFIQCKNTGDVFSERFRSQSLDVMLELAKFKYNQYMETARSIGITTSPSFNEEQMSGQIQLMNATGPGFSYILPETASITSADLDRFHQAAIDTSYQFVRGYLSSITSVIDAGQPLATSGPYAHGFARWLDLLLKQQGNALNQDLLKSLVGKKYELYKEVYFPYKINSAHYPTLSFTLFMPEEDLRRYIDKLRKVEEAASISSDHDRREKLFNVFKELIHAFTGNYSTPDEEIGKMSIESFQKLMHGIRDEGLRLEGKQNFLLSNILDESVMSNQKVNDIITTIVGKLNRLENIARQGKNYEFSFSSEDDTYFWITLDESF